MQLRNWVKIQLGRKGNNLFTKIKTMRSGVNIIRSYV